MKFIALTGLALGFFVSAAAAKTYTYSCTIKAAGNAGWIASNMAFRHDTTGKGVTVFDPVSMHYNSGKPVDGMVSVENAKRITFKWETSGKDRSGQYAPKLLYRATYIKKSAQMHVSMTPAGYQNGFQGRGSCEIKQG